MRSEKQNENFILHIEWKHMEAGGNSGVFVWSEAKPDEKSRLPNGVEVQMLKLEWVRLNTKNGVEMLDKSFEKEGYITDNSGLNRKEYFHQKVLGPGQMREADATRTIAAFFPFLLSTDNMIAVNE